MKEVIVHVTFITEDDKEVSSAHRMWIEGEPEKSVLDIAHSSVDYLVRRILNVPTPVQQGGRG